MIFQALKFKIHMKNEWRIFQH